MDPHTEMVEDLKYIMTNEITIFTDQYSLQT